MKVHNCAQRSPDWYKARLGTPTASEFGSLITSTGERSKTLPKYAKTLAGELFAGSPLDVWEGNQWTERGREMEAEAIRLYEFSNDCNVVPVGFVTTDTGHAGCSPDGLVGDDGLIEIKCCKAETHIEQILYHKKHGRCEPGYIQQPQGQMWITERKWCDLVFFHPVLPMLTVRQFPNGDIISALIPAIHAVIVERNVILEALRSMQAPISLAAE
jgi:hypothetical protein